MDDNQKAHQRPKQLRQNDATQAIDHAKTYYKFPADQYRYAFPRNPFYIQSLSRVEQSCVEAKREEMRISNYLAREVTRFPRRRCSSAWAHACQASQPSSSDSGALFNIHSR